MIGVAPIGRADEPSQPTLEPGSASEGPGLDSLLRLPESYQSGSGVKKGGATEQEWRRRFRENQEALDTARDSLAKAKAELDGAAADGANWNISPPGGQVDPTNTPLSFKLLQEIRNGREQVATLERARRQLEIEADLAGVPQEWRN